MGQFVYKTDIALNFFKEDMYFDTKTSIINKKIFSHLLNNTKHDKIKNKHV